ncbi:MAG: nitrate reductase cytochrome c-type subunit [Burkholderiaceae bacterium]
MKKVLLVALMALATGGAFAQAKSVAENEMSLSKTDPFETPVPQAYSLDSGKVRPAPLGTPPMIPHAVENFLPIKPDANSCLMCHDKPADIGKKTAKGQPQPIPASHYAKADGKLALKGTQYDCMLCHAPQADVKPLTGERK